MDGRIFGRSRRSVPVSPTLADVAASRPRLANFPTRGERSRLGEPWAKLPPIRGQNGSPLVLIGWPWGPQINANGNYGFVYHLYGMPVLQPGGARRIWGRLQF
jgi:hypothetical protein